MRKLYILNLFDMLDMSDMLDISNMSNMLHSLLICDIARATTKYVEEIYQINLLIEIQILHISKYRMKYIIYILHV